MSSLLFVDFKYNGNKARIIKFGNALVYSEYRRELDQKILHLLAEKYATVVFAHKGVPQLDEYHVQYPYNPTLYFDSIIEALHQDHGIDKDRFLGVAAGGRWSIFSPVKENQDTYEGLIEESCLFAIGQSSYDNLCYTQELKEHSTIKADIINSDSGVNALIDNHLIATLFNDDAIPSELISLNHIDLDKVQKMLDTPGDKVVIKTPHDSTDSLVIPKTNLHNYIKFFNGIRSLALFSETQPLAQIPFDETIQNMGAKLGINANDKALQVWKRMIKSDKKGLFFLLEEYQEMQEETGRMAFLIDDNQKVSFIDGFWLNPVGDRENYIAESELESIQNSLEPQIQHIMVDVRNGALDVFFEQTPDAYLKNYGKRLHEIAPKKTDHIAE